MNTAFNLRRSKTVDNLMHMDFAQLDQNQLNQVKQAESTLNSQYKANNEELILLAFKRSK